MLSRREKLLITPWQQRRYENHLRKVKQALPVIDNRPPQDRAHVWNKLKKQQLETERCAKIEKDNLTLLRKMNYIMRTSRVDHYWITPPPSFLNRVTRYDNIVPISIEDLEEEEDEIKYKDHLRKSKCPACTPRHIKEVFIPEERIPWETPKLEKKFRSKSVPPKTVPKIADSITTVKSKSATCERTRTKTAKPEKKMTDLILDSKTGRSHSIILTSGCLNLAVKFPANTIVKYCDGPVKKTISGKNCFCRNKM